MGKTSARWWVVLGLLLLSGCAHRAPARVDNSDQPYRIGREDVLDVAVWRDGDLSRTLPVRPDGFISMPMVGEVRAEGRTPTSHPPTGPRSGAGGLNVGWVSWSSLTLAVGVGLMWAARRLRRPAGPPPSA